MSTQCYSISIIRVEDKRRLEATGQLNTAHMNTYSVMAENPDDACFWLVDSKRMDPEKHVVALCRAMPSP